MSEDNGKQAYLIIAHKVDAVFRTLIQMLDHPKNEIFIHMDAKNESYNPADTEALVKHSRVIHAPRISVSRGGYSQVSAALILLDTATSTGHYEHYHVISGASLPIKTQDEIIAFFEAHHGLEFVSFVSENFTHEHWTRYYYPFIEITGSNNNIIIRALAKISLTLQKILHVHRNKGMKFYKGTDWFSITDEFARYVLTKRDWIYSKLKHTLMPTEVYLHTIMAYSPFVNNLYHKEFDDDITQGAMHLIDWSRADQTVGRPYTFRMSDLETIKNSPALFARKFDEAVDIEIVRKIQELYSA